MDSLDKLSDDELRRRLLQYGFPNYPVTSTSRKVLIKKLRNYIDGQKSKLRRETTYATRYSSDEENSPASATKSTISRGRSTMSNDNINLIMPPPPPQQPSVKSSNTSSPSLTKRNLTSYSSIASTSSPTTAYNSNIYNNENNRPIQNKSFVYIPPPIVHSDSDDDSDYYAPASEKKKVLNERTNRYSPSTLNTSDQTSKSNISPIITRNSSTTFSNTDVHDFPYKNYKNIPTTNSIQPSSPITTNHLRNRETFTNGYNNTNDILPQTDFTKRLLSFRGSTTESPMKRHDQLSYNLTNQSTPLQQYGRYINNHQSSISSRNLNNNNNNSIVYQSDPLSTINNDDDYLKKRKQPSNIQTAFKYLSNKFDELYRYKQTLVPCILLSGLIIFFVLVTFMYLTIKPDLASTLNAKTTTYTLCEKLPTTTHNMHDDDDDDEHFNNRILSTNIQQQTTTITCIEKYDLMDALNALMLIATELQKRIEIYKCKGGSSKIIGFDAANSYVMSTREIVKNLIDKNPNLRITAAIRILHNVEYLIEQNPQWLINHCDSNGNQLTFDQVLNLRETQGNCIAILHPRLPFSCYVYNKLQTFFIIVGCVGLIVALFYIIIIFYRFVRHWQLVKKEQFDNLVTDIINYLTEQSTANGTSGSNQPTLIVLNHLRDKLIPPTKRYDMEGIWQRAIQFLESNDSRIQFEIGNRNGEDCRMIRWIDTAPSPSNNVNASNTFKSNSNPIGGGAPIQTKFGNPRTPIKKWQSPAFDKSNKIKDPPTTCLKIRQMFDKYEATNRELPIMIQNAILEKVGSECKIYDIQMDLNSCCVYVHCATIRDAGRVHDEINGWWFDNRLVSIKFVRLNRYMERFPHSSYGPQCLRPSNTNNLSMTSIVNNNTNNIHKNEYNYNNRNEIEYQNNENADGGDDDDDDDDEDDDDVGVDEEETSGIINTRSFDMRRSGSIENRYRF